MRIGERRFGELPDGRAVWEIALRSEVLEACVITYGATLTALRVPDRAGRLGHVVLGFEALEPYLAPHPYLGATVGRFANRIARARFSLDGEEVQLVANEGPHQLHGGPVGLSRVAWEHETLSDGVALHHRSPHGDQGYPGALDVTVRYRLVRPDELRIDYRATTDRPTVVNLTHHSYFNLRDGGSGGVLDHELEVAADRFTPVDAAGIPTGAFADVAATPLDFRAARRLGEGLAELAEPRGGYDHNFVLRPEVARGALAARLRDPQSGRCLELRTSQPGLQLYAGHKLDGSLHSRGARYAPQAGLCLESQHFPDSPNQPAFPSTRLDPGDVYAHHASYRFSRS